MTHGIPRREAMQKIADLVVEANRKIQEAKALELGEQDASIRTTNGRDQEAERTSVRSP